ncbi:MAG: hypothetical protein AAF797_04530 [Planctomycetota bacterium]
MTQVDSSLNAPRPTPTRVWVWQPAQGRSGPLISVLMLQGHSLHFAQHLNVKTFEKVKAAIESGQAPEAIFAKHTIIAIDQIAWIEESPIPACLVVQHQAQGGKQKTLVMAHPIEQERKGLFQELHAAIAPGVEIKPEPVAVGKTLKTPVLAVIICLAAGTALTILAFTLRSEGTGDVRRLRWLAWLFQELGPWGVGVIALLCLIGSIAYGVHQLKNPQTKQVLTVRPGV